MERDLPNNAFKACEILIAELQISLPSKMLKEKLLGDPQYPSLKSIENFFNGYDVNNLTVQIGVKELQTIPIPAIAQISEKEEENSIFVVIKNITDSELLLLDPDKGPILIPIEKFEQIWTGVLMLIDRESTKRSYEATKAPKPVREIITYGASATVLFLPLLLLFYTPIINKVDFLILYFLKLIGLVIAYFLFSQQFLEHNSIGTKVCDILSFKSKKASCDAVTNSPFSKIAGISLSEIGEFYFLSGLIILIISLLNYDLLSSILHLQLLNLLTLPFIIFSLVYQKFVIKKWCFLCVATQIILIAEFLYFQFLFRLNFSMDDFFSLHTFYAYCCSFVLIVLARTYVEKLSFLNEYQERLQVYQDDSFIKKGLFSKTNRNKVLRSGISIGNPDAEISLTVFTNPLCPTCKTAHREIYKISQNFQNKININYFFVIKFSKAAEVEDLEKALPLTILHLKQRGIPEAQLNQVIHDWYSQDYTRKNMLVTWFKKYDISWPEISNDINLDILNSHTKYAEEMKMKSTPTILFNGNKVDYSTVYLKNLEQYLKTK